MENLWCIGVYINMPDHQEFDTLLRSRYNKEPIFFKDLFRVPFGNCFSQLLV